MPTAYAGRVFLILTVLYIALVAVFPRAPFSVVLPMSGEPASLSHNLRPGIDMVGGTSLIYDIEPVGDVRIDGLSQQVADALKRRVDPNGVLNLIWRPQGDTRLEIQMPLTGDSAQADELRNRYLEAQQRLVNLNVSPPQVVRVVEGSTGEERQRLLEQLATGDARRQVLFPDLAAAFDRLVGLREDGTIVETRAAQRRYEELRGQIEATNLSPDTVQAAVEATSAVREQRLAEFRAATEDFPARAEALEAYIAAADEYRDIREEIADTATLKRLLRGSGVLSFHILAVDAPADEVERMNERLQTQGPRPRTGDTLRWFVLDRPDAVEGPAVRVGPDGRNYALAWVTAERSLDERQDWGLARAYRTADTNNLPAVGFDFDPLGARLFGDLTAANIGRPLAIVLDGRLISAPNINSRIAGRGIITGPRGGYSSGELNYLINTLNAGALPARLSDDPVIERTVGPQLGRDNLRAGFIVCAVGLVVVFGFLVGYYYLAGLVAFFAVATNILIILGAMAAMNATFTLPGIAGIILAVGMSVDANILIFERLREEQFRGLSLRMALRNAYDRAFSAIIDANITTGIVAAVLYVFGSEEVAGFGLTLLIGIFASLFTALFVTKTVFGLMIDKGGLDDLGALPRTFPAVHRALEPKIDWMGKAPVFAVASFAVVAVGVLLFAMAFNRGDVLDIEFAGGTTAQFELREPMPIDQVRQTLSGTDLADPLFGALVVSVESTAGSRDTVYEVVVTNPDQSAVTEAIVARLGDRLNMREPSQFRGSGGGFEQAENVHVLPVEPAAGDVAGLPADPDLLAIHVGGVAVVLRDLAPMLDRDTLLDRVNQQRLAGAYPGEGLRGGVRTDAEVFPADNAAVVYLTNDRFLFDPGDPQFVDGWRRNMAAPAWELVVDAVADPDELQKVTNIGAQVAGEFQRNAAIALVLSVLGITLYIWVRFGDLISGVAATVALLHDTLFCIGAIGFAHLLAGSAVGNFLLLEPFRINLTMVAAILTVMGFSINDTVVVFDRIRENRGKYGRLTRGVINEAINQTLSRTVLTSLTTIITIFVMYVYGGPGIHGFTFAMLVGIVTGTYSSIIIASPLLLLGRNEEPADDTLPAAPSRSVTAPSTA